MNRNREIDLINGVLIFCVIWSHTASTLMAEEMNNLDNYLNLLLCTFHMPLFMGVSGYLFSISAKNHSALDLAKTRIRSILLPLIIWTIIYALPYTTVAYLKNRSFSSILNIYTYWNTYWYLWAVLCCSIICTAISVYIDEKVWPVTGCIVGLVLLLLPHDPFYMEFMWPFFVGGFLMERNSWHPSMNKKWVWIMVIAFLLLFLGFKECHTVYYHDETLIAGNFKSLYYSLYRYCVGFTGGYLVVLLCKVINKMRLMTIKDFICDCGRYSLALYVMHVVGNVYFGILFDKLVECLGYNPLMCNLHLFNLVITPLITLIYVMVLVKIAKALNGWTLTKRWIFGIRKEL